MSGFWGFLQANSQMLWQAIATHLFYVFVSVAAGFVLGVVLGIALSRLPSKSAAVLLPVLSVFQTVPGVVFIGLLFLQLGMVPITVIIALAIYATFPVLKNTYTGLTGVEEKYIEAAKGCGMTRFQTLLRVELPLALPSIIGGLRLSTVYTVSWAVLASMIGLGGLGNFVYQGVESNNDLLIITGAIPAAIIAVALGALIDLLQKRVVPRGLRKEAEK